MIPHIRLAGQQLVNPVFENPEQLVSWMGALQAQDYTMVKWAIGIRLKNGSLQQVDEAINSGKIIRTHVMRPTWQFVPAEDLLWMLKLSARRNRSAYESFSRQLNIPISFYTEGNKMVRKMLEGNNHLTKQEIKTEFNKLGIDFSTNQTTWLITQAEIEGIVCSGANKQKKPTYALIEERIPHSKELTKEESLALLATRYFQSHSPATLEDFTWWSGLSITEARLAINMIDDLLIKESYREMDYFFHKDCCRNKEYDNILHFLPAYDEFLISYKDRTDVLAKEHYPKAFNSYGIFRPVILYNGKIVGNWKKINKKKEIDFETSFFIPGKIPKNLIDQAMHTHKQFHASL